MKKIIKNSLLIITLFEIIFTSTLYAALGDGFNEGVYNSVTSEKATKLDDTLYKVAGTVLLILQVCAMAGVVITGVKYMYAGSEDKGKIKQTLIWMVIGTIFVFAAPAIINLISNASNNVF